MGLLADNFVLTHISLKCLLTKKWKREREREGDREKWKEVDKEEDRPSAMLCNTEEKMKLKVGREL